MALNLDFHLIQLSFSFRPVTGLKPILLYTMRTFSLHPAIPQASSKLPTTTEGFNMFFK